MKTRVLVAYGTKYGATAGIAERIGQTLKEAGLEVDVRPASQAGEPAAYDAVVLGSAVYAGRWRKEVARYLQTHEAALAARPVWLFNSGPLGEDEAATSASKLAVPETVSAAAERVRARDVTVFRGAVDPAKLNPLERLVMKLLKAPRGDFRDWAAISSWAQGIAAELQGGD